MVGIAARTCSTMLLGIWSPLNMKERLFCSMAMATKATVQVRKTTLQQLLCNVSYSNQITYLISFYFILKYFQAALAPVLLSFVMDSTSDEFKYAETVKMVCILSIIVTTPPLAIFMEIFGYRFLAKDVSTESVENGRNSGMETN